MRPDVMPNEQGMRDLIGEFETGRKAYREQDWAKARGHFEACMKMRDQDGPSTLYLHRIEEYEKQPKMENWDCVYTFKHK
jgi:adenylate cyclase